MSCLLKNGSALLLDLGKVFNWPKYLKALIEAHDAVVIDDMTSWVQFYSKTVDSMSNESPNKVLQYARARCWAQFPKCGRILVCSSIHAAAVLSWTSKSATPSKASWSQFESVNNGWHLKQKPWPSPSTFTYTLVPFNEQVIVQQGSEGQNRRPQMYILESPWSHERSFLERKLTLITKMAYQTIALLIVFAIRTYIYDSLDKIVENTWPPVPNCRPLGQMKNIYKTHSEPSDPN